MKYPLLICAIVLIGLPLGAQTVVQFPQGRDITIVGGVIVQGGSNYASMMRSRLRRDSILASLRGGNPFTAADLRTAYRDPIAQVIVNGARTGRMKQDSALLSYDAHTYERVSIEVKASDVGRERVVQQDETAARIRWYRDRGVVMDGEGFRSGSGLFRRTGIEEEMQRSARYSLTRGSVSVPYYPGREELWLGGNSFGFNDNDHILLHPFNPEAEAHYTYETGDSAQLVLPDGKIIRLRELRVVPRKAHWTLIVGSFWFDESDYRLVRAAYRPSEIVDIWEYNKWDGWSDADAQVVLGALLYPYQATVSTITVEYGLYEGRFWLPRRQTATGQIRVNIARFPIEILQTYEYSSVNDSATMPFIPPNTAYAFTDSLWRLDSLAYHGDTVSRRIAAEMRERVDRERRERNALAAARRAADTTRRVPPPPRDTVALRAQLEQLRSEWFRPGCSSIDDTTTQLVRNRRNGLDMLVRVPCNDSLLNNSPRLPESAGIPGDQLLGMGDARELAQRLDIGLQAAWGFRKPTFRTGFGDSLMRYNRVEGLSPAFGVKQIVGRGFALDGLARIGTADGVFEGEFGISRSNVRQNMQFTAYRRLNNANDWGDPFRLGASLQALLFGRDEGFYYRARGVSFGVMAQGNPSVQMKLFSESQSPAYTQAKFSLGNTLGGASFGENIVAERGNTFGASFELNHFVGRDPEGFRLLTRVRGENGMGDFAFARGLVDMTFSRGLFGIASASLTLSAGSSTGAVPAQRLFYLGGSHTVRGQRAGAATGDAFWMGRLELGTAAVAAKPVVFADLGWAGSRDDWRTPGRPLSGAGVGASFLDGLIRFDLARGIYPGTHIRFAMYFDAKF